MPHPLDVIGNIFDQWQKQIKMTKTDELDFSTALMILKSGNAVSREKWNGKNMWVKLNKSASEKGDKMTLDYLYLRTEAGNFVPWMPSQTDLLAEDWFISKE